MWSWLGKVFLTLVATTVGVLVTNWINSPAEEPSEAVKKLVYSLENENCWQRYYKPGHKIEFYIVKDDLTVKIVPGMWWADVQTRRVNKNKEINADWFMCRSLTRNERYMINQACKIAVENVEWKELSEQ